MNLCELSDDVLLSETLLAACAERAATALLLHHLCEVERRRLFAREGFSSLFDYCLRRLKMSESQAARRVNASRALALMPELGVKIESGALTLSNLSLAQVSFRREPRSLASKRSLLSELEGKTTREAEKILVSHSSLPP